MKVKPIIDNITPFDIRNETRIYFSYSGNLPYKNKITIYSASTQEVIWEETVESSAFYHIIPANLNNAIYNGERIGDKWTNGNMYSMIITVYDVYDNPNVSDRRYFYTYSTPTFEFEYPKELLGRAPEIKENNITVKLKYQQAESEPLRNYQFFLYENSRSEAVASDVITAPTYFDTNPHYFEYEYKALKNTIYYVRAVGVTEKGIPLDTGMIEFIIDYIPQDGFQVMRLRSDDNATVEGLTNVICIEPNERIEDGYIVINSEVQLLDKSLTYEHNYKIQRDFTLSLKMSRTKIYSETPTTILIMRNGTHDITVTSYVYDDDSLRYHLIVDNGLCTNNHYSNPLFVENEDKVVLHIRRVDNLYHIEALKV